jgi:glyoxylase-like metal-dependent hydrolase (beta-lactamase superfamily II)
MDEARLSALMRVQQDVYVVGRGDWGGYQPLSTGCSCNVFLLDGGDELALIDVGMPEGVDDVLRNIRTLGFDPARIAKVFLTHSHWDHAAGLAEILRATGATAFGHALARETMAGGAGIYVPEYRPSPHQAAEVAAVAEGDVIAVGRHRLAVLGIPGHTPDSLAFTLPMMHGLGCFSGDTAIGDQPTGDGIIGWISWNWRSHLPQFRDSLQRLRVLAPASLFPGHGRSHLTQEECARSLDHCVDRLEKLMAIPALGTMLQLSDF